MSTTTPFGHRGTGSQSVPFGHFVSPMAFLGEAVYTAFAAVASFAGEAARATSVKWHERRSVQALSRLDDRQLADIGIHRSDIHYLARRTAEDPRFDYRLFY